jgi:hypothetical protein
MRRVVVTLSALAVCWLLPAMSVHSIDGSITTDVTHRVNVTHELSSVPLAFTQNQGQWPDSILFRASSGGATLWFTSTGVYYQFTRRVPADSNSDQNADSVTLRHPELVEGSKGGRDIPDSVETMLIKAAFVGANPDVKLEAEGRLEYRCNYFIGNDPAKWRTDVPNYEAITLRNLYNGVDLHFSGGDGGKLTYEYALRPGANTDQVRIEYKGPAEVSQDETGRMIAKTVWGQIAGVLAGPSENADFNSDAETGPAALSGSRAVELVYSTYLGGSSDDVARGIAVDF